MIKKLIFLMVFSVYNLFALTDTNKLNEKFYEYDNEFMQVSKEYKVPFILLKAIALTENSDYNENVKNINSNNTIDYGLMQVNTIWLKEFKISKNEILDPYVNISAAAKILKNLIDTHGYNWDTIGKYHSKTDKFKQIWLSKVKDNLNYIMTKDTKNDYILVSRN